MVCLSQFKYEVKIQKKINIFNSNSEECNDWGRFCNKLSVYFADEVGMEGFAQCQYKRFIGLEVNIGGYLVARKILNAT